MGLDDKDCDEIITTKHKSFEEIVLIVDFDRHLLIISSITTSQDRESLYQGIQKLDDVTKTILHVASDVIKNNYVIIMSVPVFPNVDLQTLNSYSIFNDDFGNRSGMFVTKNDFDDTHKLQAKLESYFQKVAKEMRSIKGTKCSRELLPLQSLCGEFMAAMAYTTQYLPKISEYVPEKIDTILLNHNQITLINDPAKWKIIKGPFGSGMLNDLFCLKYIFAKTLK